MFETAIRYLVDGDDGVETILLGGLLTLFAWLAVPAVLVAGYLQRVLARTNAGEPAPSFDDWSDLFWRGLRAIAVSLAYFAVPAVFLIAVLASLLIFSSETIVVEESAVTDPAVVADPATVAEPVTSVGPDLLTVVIVLGSLALALVTSLAAWYALPAALARVAVEDRLGAAFEFGKLRSVLASESYATAWLIALVVLVVGGSLVGGLASIPLLGWALIPFASFYVNVVAFALYGQGYRDATRAEGRKTVESDQQPST